MKFKYFRESKIKEITNHPKVDIFLRSFVAGRGMLNRGMSYFREVYGIALYAIFLKTFGFSIVYLIPLAVVMFVFMPFLIGVIDYKYDIFWQRENEFNTKRTNPYFRQMMQIIDDIDKSTKKATKESEIIENKETEKLSMKERIFETLVHIRVRYKRGMTYFTDVSMYVTYAILLKTYSIPLIFYVPLFIVLFVIIPFSIGYYDMNKNIIWQREMVFHTKQANPYFREMVQKLEKIKKRVQNDDTKQS